MLNTIKVVKRFSDFAAAATTGTATIYTTKSLEMVHNVSMFVEVDFAEIGRAHV